MLTPARIATLLTGSGHKIPVTLSGDLVTDAIRTTNTDGDGRTPPDGSVGIYPAYSNLGTNGNAASNTTGWNTGGVGAISRITNDNKFGASAFKLIHSGSGASVQGGGVAGSPLTKTTYAMVAWVKGVGATIGKSVRIQMNETGGAAGGALINLADAVLTADYQLVYTIGKMAQADRTGITQYVTILSAASGDEVHFGGVLCGPASVVLPYAHTAGSTASKTAGRILVPTVGLNPTQGWVALRVRPSWTNSEAGGSVLWRPTMPVTLWQWKADVTNAITVTFDGGRLILTRTSPGGSDSAYAPFVPTRNVPFTVVAQWTSSGVAISVAGTALFRSFDTILADDFERADSSGGLGTAPTGQAWNRTGASLPRIASGRYTPDGTAAGNGYAGIDLGETPVIIGGITSYTASGQNTTLVSSLDSDFSLSNIVHLLLNDTGCNLQVRVAGGSFVGLLSYTYPTALATDGTQYPVWLALNGNTAAWMGADGSVFSVTDSRIGAVQGRYCTFETSSNGSGSFSRWESVYGYRSATAYPGNAHIPTGLPSTADIGSSAGTANHACGDILWVAFGKGRCTDPVARMLGVLLSDPSVDRFPESLQLVGLWNGSQAA